MEPKGSRRLIVASATYRQSSHTRVDLADRDSENRWLARQNRFRLEAETVRDVYLGASGLLVKDVGGPSVRPPLPDGVRELGYADSVKWPESKGKDRYRRGLYIFFQRTVPYPMLTTFDAPESNVLCVERRRSNTPLQALTLLNDPVFLECAQALARRVESSAASLDDRLANVFLFAVGRRPTERETGRLARLWTRLVERYAEAPDDAAKLTARAGARGESAAWVALARVVLNLDEVVTRG